MSSWLIVTGDLVPTGGQDVASLRLAEFLARTDDVHLVTHRVDPSLRIHPHVKVHLVRRPLGATILGEPLLRRAGRRVAARLTASGTRVIANGGCLDWPDVNWVHCVHAAHDPMPAGSLARHLKTRRFHARAVRWERRALHAARVVVCNSRRTARDVVERVGVPENRVHVVYLGTDPGVFGPISSEERRDARRRLGWSDRPWVVFVGTLGDRRKGFDTLYAAWRLLCADPGWDANLAVVGEGVDRGVWTREAKRDGLSPRIRFLGFRTDVSFVLAACDAMAHPARYDAYGLGAHEALCRGLPVVLTSATGVAERIPAELADLVLSDAEDAHALADALRRWRDRATEYAERARRFGERLRTRTWELASAEMRDVILRSSAAAGARPA